MGGAAGLWEVVLVARGRTGKGLYGFGVVVVGW